MYCTTPKSATRNLALFNRSKEISLEYWSLRLPAGRHMYRNYTTLLCSVRRCLWSESGWRVLHQYYNQTRLSRAETGHSDHASSAELSAQWHHYHDHHHYHYCHQVSIVIHCFYFLHIARQMASSTLCCKNIAQIVKLALMQKSGYSVHDSFCAKVIFHLQFKARTSVCPQMCVYIFQPRHCFLSRLENFAFYSRVSLSLGACFMFYQQ